MLYIHTSYTHIERMLQNMDEIEIKTDAPFKIHLENKSKRVNLLIRPSLYKDVQIECARMGISVNEAINQLLENWIRDCDHNRVQKKKQERKEQQEKH